ncbi:Rid family hydrolase [Kushneria phyllosphaerae]|uniref:2-iminobutanoate/2-iminopropanoate deaminase n=1 Tax=Kushneria phyllosphaerae TaxID=2100822 RepID=A0A2R8CHQ4_9GAMM|nr:Rid family hydrolase [Kushneria phyllosphaerae]SPJ32445.1 2-iminobutanoate/2-iminopropanoate deaminase [Kushneria phyllosphaerae]
MSTITRVKTGSRFEEHASYSRVVAVDNWILVSNTAGRNPDTGEIPEDVSEQLKQVFANIERGLSAVDSDLADVVSAKIFIQNPADTETVMTLFGQTMRGIDPVITVTCPPLGSEVYKVELEVTAYRGAGRAEVHRIDTSAQ